MNKNKKGEITITGVFIVFVGLIAYAALLPAINAVLLLIVPELAEHQMALFLAKLMPLFILIGLIIRAFKPSLNYG